MGDYVVVNSLGNVGVGTTTPTYQLETSKTVKAGTAMYANTRALDFDGSNDYVNLGDSPELNNVTNFTFSMWLNQDVVPASDIFFRKALDSNSRIVLETSTTSNRLRVNIDNAANSFGYLDNYNNYLVADRWHHIAVTYDGTQVAAADKLKLYIDGTYIAFTGFSGTIPAITEDLTGSNALIGYSGTSWDGQIQDFRIYSSSVGASDIAIIYQGGTYTTGMVHQYKLMEGSGTVATDTGSNVMNGTISGATWSTTNNVGIQTNFGRGALTLAPNTTNAKDGLWFGYDVNLYRSAASILQTDNTFRSVINGAGLEAISVRQKGDTQARLLVNSNGSLYWGPGNAATDVNLYRSAVDQLKTDDSLIVSSSMGVGVSSFTSEYLLDVLGTGSNNYIRIATNSTTKDAALVTTDGSNSAFAGILGNLSGISNMWQVYYGGATRLAIDRTTGNIGVGTTSQTYQLETSKTMKAGTAMYANTRALDFDGSNDYVNLGDITELNSTANFTISTWVKQDVVGITDDNLFVKSLDVDNKIQILFNNSNGMNVYLRNASASNGNLSSLSSYITAGRWHHITLVYDGVGATNADRLKLYIDGTYIAFSSFTGTIPATTANMAGSNANVGQSYSSWDGGIQDFRIYSSSVSASDIATIYQGGTYTTNMVHQYKLMEGSGLVATDTGSNVMNGTISGATWSTTNNVGIQTDFGRGALTLAPNTTNAKDGIWFGYDNSLYRSANLVISSNSKLDPASLNLQTKAGIPADGDITGGAVDGDIVLDTSNNRIYTRTGGSWMYAALSAGFQIPNYEAYSYDFSSKAFDISKPIAEGDLLIPFAEKTMSDGAMHGLYTTFDSVKQTMFDSFEQDYDTLANNYIARRSDNALTKIDSNTGKIDTLELSLSDLTTRVDALSANASFVVILKSYFTIDSNQNLSLPANLNLAGGLTTNGLTIENKDNQNKTIGQATIPVGEISIIIKTQAVTEKSRIFITPNGSSFVDWVISSKKAGESFTISIKDPGESDLSFDWWIVEEK